MRARRALAASLEWLLRRRAMQEARAAAAPGGDEAAADDEAAARQARLLIEVARRVAEPVEPFPPGSRAAVLVDLYRDAVGWLFRERPWTEQPIERLRRAAGDDAALEEVKRILGDPRRPRVLAATDDEAALARRFAEGLVWELDVPRRRIDRLYLQRFGRLALAGAAVLALGLGVVRLARGPNLVAEKHFRTSSVLPGCAPGADCGGIFFHTNIEPNPWIDFDLGSTKNVRRVEVRNRRDCCGERAVPLVVEVSLDRARWTEVARQPAPFTTWTATFATRPARYVRLMVPRTTALHLQDVEIR